MDTKYRIKQLGENEFIVQHRFMFFWLDTCEYNSFINPYYFSLKSAKEDLDSLLNLRKVIEDLDKAKLNNKVTYHKYP